MATQRTQRSQRTRVELTAADLHPVNRMVPIKDIIPNPDNPRRGQPINAESLAADFVRSAQAAGFLAIPPLFVYGPNAKGKFTLLQGQRRWEAACLVEADKDKYPLPAGVSLAELPCLVFPAEIPPSLQEELLHDHGRSEGLKKVSIAELYWKELRKTQDRDILAQRHWRSIRDVFLQDKAKSTLDEKIKECKSQSEFLAAIKTGSIRNYTDWFVNADQFGPRGRNGVRKFLGATDGFEPLPGETEPPVLGDVISLSMPSLRDKNALPKAIAEDKTAGKWDYKTFSGPSVDAYFAKLKAGEGSSEKKVGEEKLKEFAAQRTASLTDLLPVLPDVLATKNGKSLDEFPNAIAAIDRISWADTVYPLLEKHRKDKTYGEFINTLLDAPEKLSDLFGKGK